MNNIMVFENHNVEVFEFNGKILFNPYNVGDCLDLNEVTVRRHIQEMNDRQVIKLKNSDVQGMNFRKLNNAGENFLTESGVFKLAFRSKKEEAERFQDWVTDEVLPTINKYGMYATDNLIDKVVDNPDFLIDILVKYKEEKQKSKELGQQVLERDKIIEEQKPKINYVDKVLSSDSLVTITQIAKDYGMSAKTFNKILADNKIQFKVNGQWCLYSEHQGKGYTHSKTYEFERKNGFVDTKMNTLWTQKGRLFLYETLKKVDILPTIDKGE